MAGPLGGAVENPKNALTFVLDGLVFRLYMGGCAGKETTRVTSLFGSGSLALNDMTTSPGSQTGELLL